MNVICTKRWFETPRRSTVWRRAWLGCAAASLLATIIGCGRPNPNDAPKQLDQIDDFSTLFSQRCAGCHGAEGRLGSGPPLADPLALGIMPRATLREVITRGRTGTLMPPRGGRHWDSLTPKQIDIVIDGMLRNWGKGAKEAAKDAPSYLPPRRPGDAAKGKILFAEVCSSCHGKAGNGGDAGPLHSPPFLALVSDQLLRRTIIVGRPELGMPNYEGLGKMSSSGKPLDSAQIADVVAYVASWRASHDTRSQDTGHKSP